MEALGIMLIVLGVAIGLPTAIFGLWFLWECCPFRKNPSFHFGGRLGP